MSLNNLRINLEEYSALLREFTQLLCST